MSLSQNISQHRRGPTMLICRFLCAICAIVLSVQAQAKSAAEVFESVSGSIVVVYGNDAKGKRLSLGSGVALPGGEVVTNCHVIEKSDSFVVKHQEREHSATLKYSDHDRDVCSLTVKNLKAPPANLGTTKTLKVGQKVYAIGAPQGLELTMSDGIVSSLREMDAGQYIQTTAPISPGSSGGGLFDEEGRLIGLPTFYFAKGQQLNFAVPVEWIKELPKRETSFRKGEITTLAWLNKAVELENKKDWLTMIQHAQNWIKSSPGKALPWYVLGTAYFASDQYAKAIEAYQQSLRINPENAHAWHRLGLAYNEEMQPDKAIKAYQQTLRINPENSEAWFLLGATYYKTNQLTKAIEAYQQALSINPEDGEAWLILGFTYYEANQAPKSIQAYQQALRINLENAQAWHGLADSYVKNNQVNEAIEALQQTLYLDPNRDRAAIGLALIFGFNDLGAKTIESLQQSLRNDPADTKAWYSLGVAYKIEGQNDRLMEVYRQLKVLSPKKAEVFLTKFVLP